MGTVALPDVDDRATVVPPVGDGPTRVTVPVEVPPAITEAGDTLTVLMASGVIDRLAVRVVVPKLTEIIEATVWVTTEVGMLKVAVVAPAATVTDDGTVADRLFELTERTIPPVGAGPFSVTMPTLGKPPSTVVGLSVSVDGLGALMVSDAVLVPLPRVAVITAEVDEATGVVVTENVADELPALTVTEPGTVAMALPEVKLTVVPPVGAIPCNVAVPVEDVPPMTLAGARVIAVRVGGPTVSVAVLVISPKDAVMFTTVDVETPEMMIWKVAEVAPAGTVMVAGTETTELLELTEMLAPPDPAGLLSFTVPVADPPL